MVYPKSAFDVELSFFRKVSTSESDIDCGLHYIDREYDDTSFPITGHRTGLNIMKETIEHKQYISVSVVK